MEKTQKKKRLPVSERIKDIKNPKILQLYNKIQETVQRNNKILNKSKGAKTRGFGHVEAFSISLKNGSASPSVATVSQGSRLELYQNDIDRTYTFLIHLPDRSVITTDTLDFGSKFIYHVMEPGIYKFVEISTNSLFCTITVTESEKPQCYPQKQDLLEANDVPSLTPMEDSSSKCIGADTSEEEDEKMMLLNPNVSVVELNQPSLFSNQPSVLSSVKSSTHSHSSSLPSSSSPSSRHQKNLVCFSCGYLLSRALLSLVQRRFLKISSSLFQKIKELNTRSVSLHLSSKNVIKSHPKKEQKVWSSLLEILYLCKLSKR